MALRQESEQKEAKRTTVEGKTKTDPVRRTKKGKSIESEYQEDEHATLSDDVDWRENDRQVHKAKDRSKIQRGAQEPAQV